MAQGGELTKTILFSGGMQDDVSTYHQADPGMNYIENGRFRKKDEIEKRLPYVALTDTGLPAGAITDGKPLMLAEQGDTLVTLDKEGTIYTYDKTGDTQWRSRTTNITPYNAEVAYQTAPESGASNFQSYDGGDFKLLVWEQRFHGDTLRKTTPTTHTIAELRRPNGALIERKKFGGTNGAQIVATENDGTGSCYIITHTTTIIWYTFVDENGFGTTTSTGKTAHTPNPLIDRWEAYFDSEETAAGDWKREDGRLGLCLDGDNCGYFKAHAKGLIGAYLRTTTSSGLNALALDANFVTAPLTTTTVYTDLFTTAPPVPLAVHVYESGGTWRCGILYSINDATDGTGTLKFRQYKYDSNTTSWATLEEDFGLGVSGYVTNGRPINASLYWDYSNSTWRYATTLLGFGPDWQLNSAEYPTKGDCPIVLAGHINTSTNTFSVSTQLRDHRLVSEVTPSELNPSFGVVSGTVFAVEQWTPFAQPRQSGPQDEFASCPVSIRPHTTVVIEVPYNVNEYNVLGTLGAGQNKGFNASSEEHTIHLQSAYTRGDAVYITTRNILQPEDISVHLGDSNNGTSPILRKRFNVLFPGEAAGKVEKLTPATSLTTRRFGAATLVGLATPSQYDGVAFGEQSVFDQPEIATVKLGNEGYHDLAYEKLTEGAVDNWYTFTVVTGFADHLGQLHRSAPATTVWVNGASIADQPDDENQITLGVTTPLSAYKDAREYFVEVYTAQGEAAPHLAAVQPLDVSDGTGNDTSVTFTQYVYNNNGQKDPIRYSEVLYTEGDVLPSDPWPAFDDFVITSNRLFAISSETPGTIYYSKLLEENIAPEFSASLVISLGRNRKLTGIGAIDDKVIVFSEREIFAIYDTGPDNTGANGDFVVDRLQTTVGSTQPRSIVEIPEGLFFYSNISNEFHLLSRDLQVHDIGKAIQDYASKILDIKAAVVVPDEHEVRWYCEVDYYYDYGKRDWNDDPFYQQPPAPAIHRRDEQPANNFQPVFVYNYHYKKWMIHGGTTAQQVVLFQNQPTYINSVWNPFQASADVEDWENEAGNTLLWRSPWIRVNQLQSFGRIEELTFLGKYLSSWQDYGAGTHAGDILVRLRYDYEDYDDGPGSNYTDYRFRANTGDLGGYAGEGADRPSGRMQFSITPERQKCQAIQIEVAEIGTTAIAPHEPTYKTGQGFVISGMDITYTPKPGTGSSSIHKGSKR